MENISYNSSLVLFPRFPLLQYLRVPAVFIMPTIFFRYPIVHVQSDNIKYE